MAAQTVRRCSGLLERMMAWGPGVVAKMSITESLSASSALRNDKSAAAPGNFPQRRFFGDEKTITATLFRGDDIGQEISAPVKETSADQGSPQPTPISHPNPIPRLVLQRTGDPSSVGADVSSAPYLTPANGNQKVIARISNIPKFMFKSDMLWFLKGCNLGPEDLVFMYDAKYRAKHVQVNFSSIESFRLAQRSLAMKGRLGGRYLKLTQEEPQVDDINVVLQQFRGRSLVMLKLATGIGSEEVERFFTGYTLDANHPIKFFRSMIQATSGGRRPPAVPAKAEYEKRALVRFRTVSEALRALREKQGSFCAVKTMDLRFIE